MRKIFITALLLLGFPFLASAQDNVSWGWYATRGAGLVSFFLLYVSLFIGVILTLPWMKKTSLPFNVLDIHCWISLQTLIFVFIHSTSVLFDRNLNFGVADIFIPFHASRYSGLVGLGTSGFYLILTLVITSYFKKYISYGFWRAIHYLNLGLYFVVICHALFLGSDLKSGWLRTVFLVANILLIFLMFLNLVLKKINKNNNQNNIISPN